MRSWKEALKDLQIEILILLSTYSLQYQKEKYGIERGGTGVAIYGRREEGSATVIMSFGVDSTPQKDLKKQDIPV